MIIMMSVRAIRVNFMLLITISLNTMLLVGTQFLIQINPNQSEQMIDNFVNIFF